MGSWRLRHCTDGAQGVIELSRSSNGIPGKPSVFVVTSGISAASVTTWCMIISSSTTATTSTKLIEQLVLILDAPFT